MFQAKSRNTRLSLEPYKIILKANRMYILLFVYYKVKVTDVCICFNSYSRKLYSPIWLTSRKVSIYKISPLHYSSIQENDINFLQPYHFLLLGNMLNMYFQLIWVNNQVKVTLFMSVKLSPCGTSPTMHIMYLNRLPKRWQLRNAFISFHGFYWM